MNLKLYQSRALFQPTHPPLGSDQEGTGVGVILRGRASAGVIGEDAGVVGGEGEEGGRGSGGGEYHVVFRKEVVRAM